MQKSKVAKIGGRCTTRFYKSVAALIAIVFAGGCFGNKDLANVNKTALHVKGCFTLKVEKAISFSVVEQRLVRFSVLLISLFRKSLPE